MPATLPRSFYNTDYNIHLIDQVVTNKVKELLLSHNTGQKLFGEAVLGLSQVGVSYFPF